MSTTEPPGDITRLLASAREGDREAMDRLFALVYQELRVLARRQLGSGGETLRTTALVHEAYLRMGQGAGVPLDRVHFFATAARAMRHILVDHARRRQAQKRGAGSKPLLLDEDWMAGDDTRLEEILAVDQALARLEAIDPRLARLVELRFFAGMSIEETAEVLALSERTARRDWRKARAILHQELAGDDR